MQSVLDVGSVVWLEDVMTFDEVQAELRKCDEIIDNDETHLRPESVCFQIEHCGNMIYEARTFTPDQLEKAIRWLGFIQGVLSANGLMPVDVAYAWAP